MARITSPLFSPALANPILCGAARDNDPKTFPEQQTCSLSRAPSRLASPEEPETPVCIPNGCMLRISDIPKRLQKELKVGAEAVGEFREIYQRSANSLLARIFLPPRLCFDVVLFANGRSLEVTLFDPEIRVDILTPAVVAPVGFPREEPVGVR